MRRWLNACGIGLVTALVGVGVALSPLGTELEKDVALPWLFDMRGPIEAPGDVVVVGINAGSGERMGLPDLPRNWPRSLHGDLIRELTDAGASAIVFDIAYTRPTSQEQDLAFANAVAQSDRVLLVELLTGRRQTIIDSSGRTTGSVWIEQVVPPIPPLADAARALAPWPLPKEQVTVHQFWAFKPSIGDAPTMPSAAFQLAALSEFEPLLDILRRAGAKLDGIRRPGEAGLSKADDLRRAMAGLRRAFRNDPSLSERARMIVDGIGGQEWSARRRQVITALIAMYAGEDNRFTNYYGPPGSITTIPYDAVIGGALRSNDRPEAFSVRDKIVFVGFSDLDDPGQPDRFYTVFTRDDGVDLSGVEIAATALGNLLEARTLRPSDTLSTVVVIVAFGVIISLLAYLVAAIVAVPVILALAGAYAFAVQHQFDTGADWYPLADPLLVQLPLALLLGLLGQYMFERREQRRVRATMARYVDPAITDRLIAGGVDLLGGRETTATILFSDVRGFTTLSERLGPRATVALLNDYFTLMVQCIKAEGGMLDKFIGDAIMAAFGVPVEHEDDADRAVRAALAMLRKLEEWNGERRERGEPIVNIGIGLNTAEILSGNIGSPDRMDYTLIGDGVNLAARLESATKQYSAKLLISEFTYARLKGSYRMRDVDEVVVKGKTEPVRVYEVLEYHTEESFPNLERSLGWFRQGREHFTAGRWDDAIAAFREVLALNPRDRLSEIYIERCLHMQANPPENWHGVWELQAK